MKCTDVQKYLDDYLDDAMSLGEQKAVESHIEQCASCQQALRAQDAIRQALRTLPVDEASPDFEDRVFAEVRSHYGRRNKRHSSSRFVAGFATAMVAGLALWFTSTVFIPQIEQPSPQTVTVAMNQTRTVKLMFDAATDLASVTLKVELPDNIELEGYAGQKQLVWQTNLNKGQNILALPVMAIGNGQGELVAQLSYGDKTQRFRILLKTADNGALIYRVNKLKSA